jgi:hypothetical protein
MNPLGYGQQVTFLTAMLTKKFQLSLHEITSVQLSYHLHPDPQEFFGAACRFLLGCDSRVPKRYFGCKFGLLICKISDMLSKEPAACVHRRFPFSNERIIPKEADWDQLVHASVVFNLSICKDYGSTATKAKQLEAVGKIETFYHQLHQEFGPCAGPLCILHSITQKAVLGLLPRFLLRLCNIDSSSKTTKYLNFTYFEDCDYKLNKSTYPTFLDTLVDRLKKSIPGVHFTVRLVENLLCKFYRSKNPGSEDSKWVDSLAFGQPYMTFEADGTLAIHHTDGRVISILGGLIEEIGYGNASFTIERVAKLLNIDQPKTKKVKRSAAETVTKSFDWVFDVVLPEELKWPRASPIVSKTLLWRENPPMNKISERISHGWPGLNLASGSRFRKQSNDEEQRRNVRPRY